MAGARETPSERSARDGDRDRAMAEARQEVRAIEQLWLPDGVYAAPAPVAAAAAPEPLEFVDPPTAPTYGRRPTGDERVTMVASAARIDLSDRKMVEAMRRRRQAWQTEAWDYYDEVPEIGYEVDFIGNLLSKLRLFAAVRPDAKAAPVAVDAEGSGVPEGEQAIATEVLAHLRSMQGGQASLLQSLAVNFEVAGEAYLHGHEDAETGDDEWNVRSVDELVVEGDQYGLRTYAGANTIQRIPADDIVIRLWERHPRFGNLSKAAMRRVLGEAENVLLLSREIRATTQSRLSNGILVFPQEMSLGPVDPTRQGEATDDGFLASMQQAMVTGVQEPGSAAAFVPISVMGPAEHIKEIRHIKISRELDSTLDQRIEGRVLRIARGLNMPVEVTTGLQECADEETEVLSTRGWLQHDEVAAGDVVLTLNHQTGMSEWQTVNRVGRYQAVDQEMMSLEGKAHSSLTTLDHKWPVLVPSAPAAPGRRTPDGETGPRRWRLSRELKGSHRIVTAAPSADIPAEAKWSDDLVEMVAWYYTEGHIDRRAYREGGMATITQSLAVNPDGAARIRAALRRLVGPPAERLNGTGPTWKNPERPQVRAWAEREDRNRPMARFILSHPLTADLEALAPDRRPTPEFIRSLTGAQLELFLTVSRMGDGWTVNSGTRMFSQNDRGRIDAYEMACILSGRTPSSWAQEPKGGYAPQILCSVTDRTTVCPFTRAYPKRVVRYTGTVWCPSVDNGTWMARRRGRVYFTGNTTFANAAAVKKSEWDAHGEPRATLIVDALTSGYYQWMLEEAGMEHDRAREHFIWYDPTDCLSAPDPVDSADHGVAEGLIGSDAWRRIRGYAETDAPTPEDLALQLAIKMVRQDPMVAAQLIRDSGIAPNVLIPAPAAGVINTATGEVTGGTTTPDPALLAAALLSAGRPHRAAGTAGARLGRRLAAIDRDLRLRLRAAAERELQHTLERAGNMVRRKAKDGATREVAAQAGKASLVAAALGRQVVVAMGLTDDTLLGGEFDDLAAEFGVWVDVAYGQALEELERVVGPLDAAVRQQVLQQAAASGRTAAEWLQQEMGRLAAAKLYDPTPGFVPLGESDASTVPAWLVRYAVGLAGGDDPKGGGGAPLLSQGGGPVMGIGTGPNLISEATGVNAVEAYQWDYGSAPRNPFEPHMELDGTVALNFDDDIWANDEGWPDLPYYQPSDHDGCTCDVIPIFLVGGDAPDVISGDDGTEDV